MKRILTLITLIFTVVMTSVSCQEFQLNEHLQSTYMIVNGGEYNKKDSTTRRAFIVIGVEGLNEDEYTIEYTIDNLPGTGANALHKPDQTKSQWTYNSQDFTGQVNADWDNLTYPRLEEQLFSDEYDGNFPSGSSTTFHYLFTGVNKHPSDGATHFLSPKLKPGKHTIEYTVKSSYGDVITNTKEFVIKDKPKDE